MKATQSFTLGLTAALVAGSFLFGQAVGQPHGTENVHASFVGVAATTDAPQDNVRDMTF